MRGAARVRAAGARESVWVAEYAGAVRHGADRLVCESVVGGGGGGVANPVSIRTGASSVPRGQSGAGTRRRGRSRRRCCSAPRRGRCCSSWGSTRSCPNSISPVNKRSAPIGSCRGCRSSTCRRLVTLRAQTQRARATSAAGFCGRCGGGAGEAARHSARRRWAACPCRTTSSSRRQPALVLLRTAQAATCTASAPLQFHSCWDPRCSRSQTHSTGRHHH